VPASVVRDRYQRLNGNGGPCYLVVSKSRFLDFFFSRRAGRAFFGAMPLVGEGRTSVARLNSGERFLTRIRRIYSIFAGSARTPDSSKVMRLTRASNSHAPVAPVFSWLALTNDDRDRAFQDRPTRG
jgi:hypothetical protein